MKRILLTGATGFVGSAIAKIISRDYDYEVLVATHISTLSEDRLEMQGTDIGVTWVQGSLTDYQFLARTVNAYEIDTIIHMAAESIVRIASRDPLTCFRTNIEGTWNLLEVARQSKTVKAFVGASSDKAYGVHKELPYKEDFSLNAVHTYDASKACADILMRTYAHNYGLPVVVTRGCNIYGPGDFNYSRIIPNSIRRLMEDKSPIIWNGVHNYVREFIHADDVASAILLLTSKAESVRGRAFNLSHGDKWRVEDLVNFIAETMEKPIKVSVVDKELEFLEIPEQYLDGSALAELGWKPSYTIRDGGIESTIDWYLDVFERGIK